MGIISKLKKKYNKQLKSAQCPRALDDFDPTVYLFQKWAYKSAGEGWYMFDLNGAPFVWALIVDEFMEWLDKKRPDFRVRQCAIKFGRLKFYTDYVQFLNDKKEEECEKAIGELCEWLYDKRLVY